MSTPVEFMPIPVGTWSIPWLSSLVSIGSKPQIRPTGIGDLKVIKQVLAWYEDGEIAHIENILEGELRRREHRRLRQLEETYTVETVREEESEKDLQSTERFELKTETEKVIKEETQFSAGLSLSANYGSILQISANTEVVMNNSTEESNRTATTYAKEVTERAVARLTERVREERVARVLQEFEEKNLHEFEGREERMSGIYCWVDKYYRTWVEDYGQRLFYTFYVPEPAAFYLQAKANDTASMPEWPEAPEIYDPDTEEWVLLAPDEITPENYLTALEKYNAEGVEPPPPEYTVVAKSISREAQNPENLTVLSEEIDIPSGYVAKEAYVWSEGVMPGADSYFNVIIGKTAFSGLSGGPGPVFRLERVMYLHGIYLGGTAPSYEDQVVPISMYGTVSAFVINCEVFCQLTDEAREKWQITTYNAIMAAYQKALMEYDDKVAAAEVSGTPQWGQNPDINREIEKQELKKSCIAMWSAYATEGSSPAVAEANNDSGYPEIDAEQACENAVAIRFFEEAFEWENMAYEFLPYFWGNKEKWINTYTLTNEDPIFEQFLRAGAANVKVPVRPSYTAVVLYYQLTGQVWTGDPKDVPALEIAPLIDNSGISREEIETYNGYLSDLVEEMEAEEEGAYDELPNVVESPPEDAEVFLVKVPTSLVHLRQSDELPNYASSSEPNP